jgi:F420-dependent oxidoreductase-like protein
LKLGLQINRFNWPGSPENVGKVLADAAVAADEGGFYSLWVMDHFFQIRGLGPAEDPMLESYSALNYFAGVTKKVKLGTMVTGGNYRDPGLLLKTATTLDVLSGGRAYLGIGAGWNGYEANSLGLPFPPTKERFERLEEILQIAKQVWRDDSSEITTRHFHLERPIIHPQPLSKPHPPILIGGGGEKKTLKLVAQYADACNLFLGAGVEALQHKLDVLKGHCEKVGRNYDEIEKTAMFSASPDDPQAIIDICKQAKNMGLGQVMMSHMKGFEDIEPIRKIGREVIPEIAGL